MTRWASVFACRKCFTAAGVVIVFVAGLPSGAAGTTNLLRIATV